jgi:adenylate cyclase
MADLGMETREISVLFSDIIAFTSLSETCETERLIQSLEEFFSEMTEVIQENHGMVDKYIGKTAHLMI